MTHTPGSDVLQGSPVVVLRVPLRRRVGRNRRSLHSPSSTTEPSRARDCGDGIAARAARSQQPRRMKAERREASSLDGQPTASRGGAHRGRGAPGAHPIIFPQDVSSTPCTM
jgi:hypothetical protein